MKKIIWVEKLGIAEIILLLIKYFFSDITVRYDEHRVSTLVKRFLNLLGKLNVSMNMHPANLSLNKKDSKGYALKYQMEENLNICLEGFCRHYIPDEPEWFKRMSKSYLGSFLSHRISFITMIEAKSGDLKGIKHEIFIVRHPVNSLVMKYYQQKGFNIKQSFSVRGYFVIIIKPIYYFFMTLLSQIVGRKVRSNIDNIRPSIWVEYLWIYARGVKTTLAFWKDYVNEINYDLVYYMDRKDAPVSKEAINVSEQHGFKWMDCQKIYNLAQLSFTDINEILSQFIKYKYIHPIWFNFFLLESLVLFKLYRSVYDRFQVKILIQHQELTWRQGIQARAVESAGGIMLGFHWSNFPFYTEPQHLTPQQVYFVWGKMMYDWVQRKGNTSRYILSSGLWIMGNEQKPEQLNDFTAEVNFIISIFDSSVGYNTYQSTNTLSQFYLEILNLFGNNLTWGGIIKSKNTIAELLALPNGKKILSKIKCLSEQKRLVFLSKWLSPVTASAYADLSVCYGLNSAGIVASIHGHPAIHWDCSGWLRHPFYKKPNQKILYPSFNEFKEAIVKASKGDKTIGDFSAWRQYFNYFNDFRAPARVGRFIQDFMEKVRKTDNTEHSLDFAVKKYIDENKVEDGFIKCAPDGQQSKLVINRIRH